MILLNDNILVSELQDDIMYNGTVVRYDSDNPYMICHVEEVSDEAKNVSVGNIIVIKRYAKEEYLPGLYFVSYKDVRGIIPSDKYEDMIV